VSQDRTDQIAAVYRRFAEREAMGRSPLYVELARNVARDRELLSALAGLPPVKRQPNLLFTAVSHLRGIPDGWPEFRTRFLESQSEVIELMLARAVQTNEPARCATLLPLLATLPQPLALLEVGAAAGLCLLVDRYGYDYDGHRVSPVDMFPDAPVFACQANSATPLPTRGVEVVWRAGLDLEPVDLADPADVAWLESLVWPGEGRRLEQLRSAIAVARADPPCVVRGDLRHDLRSLAELAPGGATLVIFHTAVLAYVSALDERRAFGETVRALGATWIANEGADVVGTPRSSGAEPWPTGRFLLTLDGAPIAWTDPHGTAIEWLGD
jgi:hypothetical protein